MRNWAFLACRTIALACGIFGGQQLMMMMLLRRQSAEYGGSDIWELMSFASPVYFLVSALLLFFGADLISRMLIPEPRDGDLPAPAMSVRELASAAWSIVGIWFVVRSAPKLLYLVVLWIWSQAGAPPPEYLDELQKVSRESIWASCEFAIGAIVFILAARSLGFKSEV